MGFKFGDYTGYIVVKHTINYIIIASEGTTVPDNILTQLENDFIESKTFSITHDGIRYVIMLLLGTNNAWWLTVHEGGGCTGDILDVEKSNDDIGCTLIYRDAPQHSIKVKELSQ